MYVCLHVLRVWKICFTGGTAVVEPLENIGRDLPLRRRVLSIPLINLRNKGQMTQLSPAAIDRIYMYVHT